VQALPGASTVAAGQRPSVLKAPAVGPVSVATPSVASAVPALSKRTLRVTTVSPERSTFWLLLVGARRLALTPVGAGVYGAVVVHRDADLRQQVVSLVTSALIDDPAAGVAITRGGRLDAMSFRANEELGGPMAAPSTRAQVIAELVDDVFVNHHPSLG
jgi:hypothetical protein